ncbi:MAG: hypothetical protein K2X74_10495 [Acetobacteraceae bacterium]|nr:hypothetical protein [Acetobacteraceae bacterium]
MAGKRRMETGRFVPFDVTYEDGTLSSNRKVPAELLGGLDGDQPARDLIEEQEREIAERSGKPARVIASIRRSGVKEKDKGYGSRGR